MRAVGQRRTGRPLAAPDWVGHGRRITGGHGLVLLGRAARQGRGDGANQCFLMRNAASAQFTQLLREAPSFTAGRDRRLP